MRLRRVAAKGFRSLKDVSLLLEPLTVMIGPNSAGKTSLLRVFYFAAQAADGRLGAAISAEGTLREILTRDEVSSLWISVEAEEENTRRRTCEPLRWSIELEPTRTGGYRVINEALSQHQQAEKSEFKFIERKEGHIRYHDPKRGKLVAPDWSFEENESALGQVRRTYSGPE